MERPWTSFYGPSVRAEIDELPFRNLGDLVSHTASVYGEAPAFTVCLPNGMNGTDEYASFLCLNTPDSLIISFL